MKEAREIIEGFLEENEDTIVPDIDAKSLIVLLRYNGFVIMPLFPSEQMLEAARKEYKPDWEYGLDGNMMNAYRAMVQNYESNGDK